MHEPTRARGPWHVRECKVWPWHDRNAPLERRWHCEKGSDADSIGGRGGGGEGGRLAGVLVCVGGLPVHNGSEADRPCNVLACSLSMGATFTHLRLVLCLG